MRSRRCSATSSDKNSSTVPSLKWKSVRSTSGVTRASTARRLTTSSTAVTLAPASSNTSVIASRRSFSSSASTTTVGAPDECTCRTPDSPRSGGWSFKMRWRRARFQPGDGLTHLCTQAHRKRSAVCTRASDSQLVHGDAATPLVALLTPRRRGVHEWRGPIGHTPRGTRAPLASVHRLRVYPFYLDSGTIMDRAFGLWHDCAELRSEEGHARRDERRLLTRVDR